MSLLCGPQTNAVDLLSCAPFPFIVKTNFFARQLFKQLHRL